MMSKNKFFKVQKLQAKRKQAGSILLEAMIAVLIFSFGILAIAGLQAAMMKNTAEATYRAEAAYRVQQYLGSLMVKPYGLGQGAELDVETLPNGKLIVTGLSDGRLSLRVTWKTHGADSAADPIGGEKHQYEAITSIFTAR
jgi:type IV pilus assembly protein PilV